MFIQRDLADCYPIFRLRVFTLTMIFLLLNNWLFSQNTGKENSLVPVAGEAMPEFLLKNVEYYSKSEVTLNDFKGKWLVLDFWYRGCTSCILSFPKTDSLQKQFSEHVQFVLVGVNSKRAYGKGIKPLFEKLREKQRLNLPIVYDSVLAQRWDIHSYPHLIIVNPNGIVYSITAGHDLTSEKMEELLNGKNVFFEPKDVDRPAFEGESISDSNLNVIYRSLLTRWAGENQHVGEVAYQYQEGESRVYKIARAPLIWLYKIGWFGKSHWLDSDKFYSTVYPFPVFEVTDRSIFDFDFSKGTGIYNYEIKISTPEKAEKRIMSSLQKDLQTSFGFSAVIENRKVPVWKLIAKPGSAAKLKTKGEPPGYVNDVTADGGAGGFEFRNYPIDALLMPIRRYINSNEPPLLDETGITGNIDFKMDALMTDMEQVKKELQKNGLDIVKGEKLMKVLVIREPK